MNYRTVFHTLGNILIMEGIILIIPFGVACVYREKTAGFSFLTAIIIALILGILLTKLKKTKHTMQARDGFTIVALSWVVMSLVGAVPFFISGEIPNFEDAFFETVSGLTTTGASILTDIESLSKSMLFWRCFTNWLGGMGILVFMLAILPLKGESTVHILRAESTGPSVSKIVPKMQMSASILYSIYIILSLIELILLLAGGMPFFDSITHMFATAGTGGFSIKNASVGFYESSYIRIVITVFMLLFGLNFTVYFLIIMRKFKYALRNSEVLAYLVIVAFSIITITVNIRIMYANTADAIIDSSFTVASIITTTGFSTVNYDMWPGYSKIVLLILMFTGACAGSTAGGFKISRIIILAKSANLDLRHMLSPHSVKALKVDNKVISRDTLNATYSYFVLYSLLFVISLILISFNDFDMLTTISSVMATINNIGPGFGDVGPTGNYSEFNALSKVIFSVNMLAGRLEIFPIVLLFYPKTWKKY